MDNHSHHEAPVRQPGWNDPKPLTLPPPTIWPTLLALCVVFMAWGSVTSLYFTLTGLIGFAVSIVGWIGDLRHDRKN